jgi:hypothetical protein
VWLRVPYLRGSSVAIPHYTVPIRRQATFDHTECKQALLKAMNMPKAAIDSVTLLDETGERVSCVYEAFVEHEQECARSKVGSARTPALPHTHVQYIHRLTHSPSRYLTRMRANAQPWPCTPDLTCSGAPLSTLG